MPFVFRETGGVGFYEVSGWKDARGVFTTRRGGVSQPPFESLNLGAGSGDSPEVVQKNRELLDHALGLGGRGITTVRQVHGNEVYVYAGPDAARPGHGYDAIITDVRGAAIGVLTADCVPILMHDPVRGAVAAVHAGWAGTLSGIAGRAVAEMSEHYGTDPSDVRACIGPSIGACCYEVDEKVMGPLRESLRGWWPELVAGTRPGHWLLDLWKANARVLVLAGLREDRVSVFGLCTACNPDKFYSHRRSGGRAGRMLAVSVLL